MAEAIIEREYIIPLRRAWMNVPRYERTGKAIKEIKKFLAKHMKVENRDVDKVKLDVHFNNEIWFRGMQSPPGRVKVKVKKENGIVYVNFASETHEPKHLKFLKARHERRHREGEVENKIKQKEDIKTDEQKKDEKEKEQSVAEQHIKEAKQDAKARKHTTKKKEESYHRMALQK